MDFLREDIKTLETALNRFRTVDRHISSMNASLDNIAAIYITAFSSEKSAELSSAMKAINEDLIAVRGKVLEKIENEKSALESQLEEMKKDDDIYHEEERRRLESKVQKQTS